MITKRPFIDYLKEEVKYNYHSIAITLPNTAVSEKHLTERDLANVSLTLSRTHASGWTITGEVEFNYYVWICSFIATHPKYGQVWGDFGKEVHADTEEGFDDFYKNHRPKVWDYGDI